MSKMLRIALFLGLLACWLAACVPQPQRFTLTAHDMHWDVHQIQVRANQPVELTLRNHGALDHVFQIDSMDVQVLLSPGDVEIITFTVPQPAIIDFICSIPGHEEAGMVGQIVVTE